MPKSHYGDSSATFWISVWLLVKYFAHSSLCCRLFFFPAKINNSCIVVLIFVVRTVTQGAAAFIYKKELFSLLQHLTGNLESDQLCQCSQSLSIEVQNFYRP